MNHGYDIHTDAEISSISEDRLERSPFARRVTDRILKSANGPSVVFGLSGPWGSGKTSVLKMIEEILTQENANTWKTVWFTPWSAADAPTLTEEFYRAIASAIPTDNDHGTVARKLLARAVPAASAFGKVIGTALVEKWLGKEGILGDAGEAVVEAVGDQTSEYSFDPGDPDPFIDRFTDISTAIKNAGRNVLVIVDDLDRLHSDELLSVMKAVRLLGRFDRVHYLLSYDDRTVLDVLETTDLARAKPDRARAYLEKIVQYPFMLPPLQDDHLARELRTCLEDIARNHELDTTLPDGYSLDPADYIDLMLPQRDEVTLRTIYRLFHQVDVLLTLVGSTDLDLVDATLLTILRIHHPDLYRQLPQLRRELLGSQARGKPIAAQEWKKTIAKHTQVRPNDPLTTDLYRLLMALFPKIERHPEVVAPARSGSCRISDDHYFDRYFAFRIPVRDISDQTVRTELTHLLTTGTWPASSQIVECLEDSQRRTRARVKILGNTDLIAQTSPKKCAEAALQIAKHLDPHGRALTFGHWSTVLYPLLSHAICTAGTTDAAKEIADNYRQQVGLTNTVCTLAYPTHALPADDLAKLKTATAEIRDEVHDLVIDDLTTDRPYAERQGKQVLSFRDFLDEEMWQRLRAETAPLLESDQTTQLDLAARFVSTFDQHQINEFHSEDFVRLVPRESWRLDQLPTEDHNPIDDTDTSLTNRKLVAAKAIRVLAGRDNAEQ
ncbi:P-loop NTPase fold protein [Rhodococcus zopfii]|uniref:KAP family P-loop NTPase fold protein n=1 Tax=Rhodococcus zopfii TaxID=43772 RepID=UPI003652D57E